MPKIPTRFEAVIGQIQDKKFMEFLSESDGINIDEIPNGYENLTWEEAGKLPINLEVKQSYLGIYLYNETTTGKFNKDILICTFRTPNPQKSDERFIVCNSQLKQIMEQIPVGSLCNIWCTDELIGKNFDKPYKKYRVQFVKNSLSENKGEEDYTEEDI